MRCSLSSNARLLIIVVRWEHWYVEADLVYFASCSIVVLSAEVSRVGSIFGIV